MLIPLNRSYLLWLWMTQLKLAIVPFLSHLKPKHIKVLIKGTQLPKSNKNKKTKKTKPETSGVYKINLRIKLVVQVEVQRLLT